MIQVVELKEIITKKNIKLKPKIFNKNKIIKYINIEFLNIYMKQLTKELILKTLEDNKTKLQTFGIQKLLLFGSYARDEQHKESDIDFLVTFKENRGNFDDFIKLKHTLEDLFHTKIDLVEEEYVREELKPYIYGGKLYETRI